MPLSAIVLAGYCNLSFIHISPTLLSYFSESSGVLSRIYKYVWSYSVQPNHSRNSCTFIHINTLNLVIMSLSIAVTRWIQASHHPTNECTATHIECRREVQRGVVGFQMGI